MGLKNSNLNQSHVGFKFIKPFLSFLASLFPLLPALPQLHHPTKLPTQGHQGKLPQGGSCLIPKHKGGWGSSLKPQGEGQHPSPRLMRCLRPPMSLGRESDALCPNFGVFSTLMLVTLQQLPCTLSDTKTLMAQCRGTRGTSKTTSYPWLRCLVAVRRDLGVRHSQGASTRLDLEKKSAILACF